MHFCVNQLQQQQANTTIVKQTNELIQNTTYYFPTMAVKPHLIIQKSCNAILQEVRSSCLNFGIQETPHSIYLTIRKSLNKSKTKEELLSVNLVTRKMIKNFDPKDNRHIYALVFRSIFGSIFMLSLMWDFPKQCLF